MSERPPDYIDVETEDDLLDEEPIDDEEPLSEEESLIDEEEPLLDDEPIVDEDEPLALEEPLPPGARNEIADEAEEDSYEAEGADVIGRAGAVLKYIVEHIVDDPSQISIGATTDDRGPVLLLSVAEEDRGKVIGRQGRIVQAIRTVVKAATVGTGERVSVEIVD
ncbi:MAG: KH domain-containing protein [Candidatus Eremiobacter antarcticus]